MAAPSVIRSKMAWSATVRWTMGRGAWGGELSALFRQAAPIAATQGGLALMGFVDTAVAGRAGQYVLGAVGLGNAIFFAVSAFGFGLMTGMDPLIAQAIGAGQASRARALVVQGAWLSLIAGLLLWMAVSIPALLVDRMGFDPEVAHGTESYLLIRAPSLIPLFLFLNFRSYLQAVGRTGSLVVAIVVANLANLGLDVLLIFGGQDLPAWTGPLRQVPAFGPGGSAFATLACVGLLALILYLAVRRLTNEGSPPSRAPHWKDIRLAARVGAPIGLHIAAEVGVFALAGVLAAKLGSTSMAAHQIAVTFGSLSFCVALGIANAGSVRVGWAVGARDTPRARISGFVALVGGAGFMACTALVFFVAPTLLARIMTDDPLVLGAVVPLMAVAAAFQISDGLQGVGAGVLRGAGDTRFTFWANLVGHYAIGLPVAVALGLGLGWGLRGIWWGLCAGLTAVAMTLVWRFHRLSGHALTPLEPGA